MTDPGWYNAEGDPPGTHRYWDGSTWVGDAVAAPGAAGSPGGFESAGRGPRGRASDPGKRILGRVVDFIILLVILVAFVFLDLGGLPDVDPDAQSFQFRINDHALDTTIEILLWTIFIFVWHAGWTHLTGATPGKHILGMRVADNQTNGVPVSLQQAALRAAHYLIGILGLISVGLGALGGGISLLIGLVSLILLFSDDEHRTVMDRVANTLVVDKS